MSSIEVNGGNVVYEILGDSGDLIVQWGAPLSPEGEAAEAILAYVKTVPEQGGNVLMQDGKTIKKMTADEFKTAPKAGSR